MMSILAFKNIYIFKITGEIYSCSKDFLTTKIDAFLD